MNKVKIKRVTDTKKLKQIQDLLLSKNIKCNFTLLKNEKIFS